MKKIYLLLVVLFSALAVNAQTVKEGDILLNAGLGLGTYDTDNLSFPALAVSADYMLKDNLFDNKSSLSVGAYTGFYRQSWDYTSTISVGTPPVPQVVTSSYSANSFIIGARSSVHYRFVDKLDTYAGLMLAYRNTSVSANGSSASTGKMRLGIHIGARYFFTDKIGAFAELGYGISPLELGVSFKF